MRKFTTYPKRDMYDTGKPKETTEITLYIF